MDKIIHIHFLGVQNAPLLFDSNIYSLVYLLTNAMQLAHGKRIVDMKSFLVIKIKYSWSGVIEPMRSDQDLMVVFKHFKD